MCVCVCVCVCVCELSKILRDEKYSEKRAHFDRRREREREREREAGEMSNRIHSEHDLLMERFIHS